MEHSITSIIQSLRDTSSRNEKEEILTAHQDNDLLKKTFELVCNPYFNFFITNVPEMHDSFDLSTIRTDVEITEEIVIQSIYQEINSGNGRAEFKQMTMILNYLAGEEDVKSLLSSIIKKDLDCGVSTSTVNKVWDELIPTYKVMKAEEKKHLSSMTYPAFADRKIDAARMTAYITPEGAVELKSSSGRTVSIPKIEQALKGFYETISTKYYDGCVVDGEVVAKEGNKVLPRKVSNGRFNKVIQGTATEEELESFTFMVFDLLSSASQLMHGYDSRPLIDRRKNLITIDQFNGLEEVMSFYVENEEEALRCFDDAVEEGEEGIVVKAADSPYETKRSKHWVKLKKEYQCEVVITGATPHTKKDGMIGSLHLSSKNGEVIGKVGTKISDETRKLMHTMDGNGDLVGSICTIRFHELTDKKGQLSFYLPVFIEFRDDKNEADDLATIEAMM